MRSLLLARLTADWMWRKRHRLYCRRRVRRLRAMLLALERLADQLARVLLADDQRLGVVPAVLRHRALGGVGELRRALGVGDRAARERRESAEQNQQRPYPPHPNGNVHHVAQRTTVTCDAPQVGRSPRRTSAPACERIRGAAGRASEVQIRPGGDQAGPEHDLDRRRRRAEAQASRLDRRLPPQPRAGQRHDPARRRPAPAPRGVAHQRRSRRSRPARRRPTSGCPRASAGATSRATSGCSTT